MAMNSHQPMLPQVPPATPLTNGRPGHNVPYAPSPHSQQQVPYYQGYQYQYPPQFPRPPQQWTPYPVHMPMGRSYQPYPPMTPYHVPPQHLPPIRPSPQQAPSSSSLRSVQGMLSPSSSNTSLHIHPPTSLSVANPHLAPPTPPPPPPASPTHRTPFYPPLPWQSFEGTFPPRAPRRRRKTPIPQSCTAPVELPSRQDLIAEVDDAETIYQSSYSSTTEAPPPIEEALAEPQNLVTPSTSHPPSEDMSTQPTTPSSAAPSQQVTPKNNASGRPNVPIVPIVPAIPNIPLASRPSKRASVSGASDAIDIAAPLTNDQPLGDIETAARNGGDEIGDAAERSEAAKSPPFKAAPKSWADLVRTMGPPPTPGTPQVAQVGSGSTAQVNGFAPAKAGSLAEALSSYSVKESSGSSKFAFLEPRGLVNAGNMCYMNSILQVLVFCVPFYNFLENIGRQAAHSFKSDTPILDAMIMFMREFKVIDAAVSVDQLRMRLKDNELEQYGEPFTPDFVYEVIQRLPRFSSMRRGHQQDAEEFLGFLLEEMHEECSRAMRSINNKSSSGASTPTNGVTSPISESTDYPPADEGGWLEVGPKQRAAITRSSGAIANESPVTKIFGGKLRSELRVPGMKNSVTLEPYQALQLDIGAPHLNNIIDALKALTKPETLHGAFNSPRGPGSTATKQVTIETLPQVLILHLKRFQYDSSGGTQKIWRKVGYPLDLEIPKEVLPQHQRGRLLAHGGLPKYRLSSVLYHHGKNAGTGHYTADVLRQDEREWIRLDDTIIRRIRSRDVAEGGSEEDPRVLAAALEQHKNDQHYGNNLYDQFGTEDEDQKQADKGWSEVNGGGATAHSTTSKKWSGVANGNVTPTMSPGKRTPIGRASIKDNKVAYMLFYERVTV